LKRLKIILAVLAMVLFAAGPAAAETFTAEIGGVTAEATSVFLGNVFGDAEVGPAIDAEAESMSLFF